MLIVVVWDPTKEKRKEKKRAVEDNKGGNIRFGLVSCYFQDAFLMYF